MPKGLVPPAESYESELALPPDAPHAAILRTLCDKQELWDPKNGNASLACSCRSIVSSCAVSRVIENPQDYWICFVDNDSVRLWLQSRQPMLILHFLAGICAIVLGGVGWLQYSTGTGSLGGALLLTLMGVLLPYVFALCWAILVVPPSPSSILASVRNLGRDRAKEQRRLEP